MQNQSDINTGRLIAYRPATTADWPAVRALLQSCDLPLAGAGEHLGTFMVATVAGRIVACAGIEPYGNTALLRSCAVDVPNRNQGLGAALCARAIALAKNLGIRQLVLLTTTGEGYFPRFGFKPVARENLPDAIRRSEEFRGACPASACAMALSLAPAGD